jgi:diacylglycerol kinase family enzyme
VADESATVWYGSVMPEPVPVPGAETRPLIIANPASGSGRTGRSLSRLIAAVRAAVGDLDVAETGRRGDATALAAAAARDRRPLVIGLGGDGTLDEIVNGLLTAPPAPGTRAGTGDAEAGSPGRDAASLPALGIVGTGTGGDYGRSLGIPHELDAYLAALAGGAEHIVDVGWARFPDLDGHLVERYWINVLSAGLGGLVDRYTAAAPAFLGGRLAYAQATLRAIVTCRRVKLACSFVDAQGLRRELPLDAHAVAICNGRTFGGGMNIAPMAQLDDGLLEVIAFQTRTRWRLVGRFRTIYSGRHLLEAGVDHFTCREVELRPASLPAGRRPRAGLFPLDVDGDAIGDVPVKAGVARAALRVRAPATP